MTRNIQGNLADLWAAGGAQTSHAVTGGNSGYYRYCPECGWQLTGKFSTCPRCGADLRLRRCPYCGGEVPLQLSRCPHCTGPLD